MQRVLVTTDLPPWDLQLRSDPPSYALGATTYLSTYSYLLGRSLTVIFVFSLQWFITISLHDAVPILSSFGSVKERKKLSSSVSVTVLAHGHVSICTHDSSSGGSRELVVLVPWAQAQDISL